MNPGCTARVETITGGDIGAYLARLFRNAEGTIHEAFSDKVIHIVSRIQETFLCKHELAHLFLRLP